MDSERLTPPAIPARARRWQRAGLAGLLVLTLVLGSLAALLVIPGFSPARGPLLAAGLRKLDAALPGRFEIGSARWPRRGRIELRDVRWLDGTDTLAVVSRLDADVDVAPLFRHDLSLGELTIEAPWLDLIAIHSRLRAGLSATPSQSTRSSFFRDGPLPGIPSFGVRALRIDAARVRTDTTAAFDHALIEGSLAMLQGKLPGINVRRLQLSHPANALRIDEGRLTIDLSGEGRIEADGRGHVGTRWPFTITGKTLPDGRFMARVAQPADRGPAAEPEVLVARGRFQRLDGRVHGIDIDTFTASFRDLRVRGVWRILDGVHDGTVHAEVRGPEWLAPWLSVEPWMERVAVTFDIRSHGRMKALHTELLARGRTRISGMNFDDVRIAASQTLGAENRMRFSLTTRAKNDDASLSVAAATTGELRVVAGRYEVRLAPVHLEDRDASSVSSAVLPLPSVPAVTATFGAPVVAFTGAPGPTIVRDLRFSGGFGEGRFNARIERGAGPYDATVSWRQPPEALMARLNMDVNQRRTLSNTWDDSTAYQAALRGRFAARDPRLSAEASFVLPGPAALSEFFPADARVADLGSFVGTWHYETMTGGWKMAANLDPTRWVERLRLSWHQSHGAITFDEVDARLPGVTATLHSVVRGKSVEGRIEARVRDSRFLARFAPALDSVELRAGLQGRLSGAASAPDIELAFIAGAATATARVPQWSGRALVRGGHLIWLDSVAPRGATWRGLKLDSLQLKYAGAGGAHKAGDHRGHFSLVAGGSHVTWAQQGSVYLRPALAVETDSLLFTLDDKDLRAQRPFRLTWLTGGFQIDSLRMAGTMGDLAAHGSLTRDVSSLTLKADLNPPALPASLGIPAGLAPSRLELALNPSHGDSLELSLAAHDLQIGSRRYLVARTRLVVRPQRMVASLELAGDGTTLLRASARMPGHFALLETQAPTFDGPLEVDAQLTGFPLPPGIADPLQAPGYLDRTGMPRSLSLDAELHLRGTGGSPEGTLAGVLTFPGWKALKQDRIQVQASLAPAGKGAALPARAATPIGRARDYALAAFTPAPAPSAPGITAQLVGTHAGREAMRGQLSLPMRVSLIPLRAEPIAGHDMKLALDSPDMPLEMLAPFAPALNRLQGRAQLHLSAQGSPLDPTFESHARIASLDAGTPQGSRLTARGDITATGTRSHPVIRGQVHVDHGVITLPDQQKLLHPIEAQALLWQGRGITEASPPDKIEHPTPPVDAHTTEAPVHGMQSPGTAAQEGFLTAQAVHRAADSLDAGSPLVRALDLDVQIVAAGGAWVRGRGLNVELGGDVQLTQKNGIPTLLGDLTTRGGGMQLYGRRMDIEKGTVTFYGGSRLNPALDLTLAKRSSRIDIVAHVTGTAENPRVDISSDPALDQSEILSYLLFDRPLESLDATQNRRVEEEATGQAEAYLAAQLTGRISSSLGLDLLSYERSQTDSTGSGSPSITLGKYLTPQILLKLEQNLSNALGPDVVLEYWIRRGLRLSTHAQQERSGLGLDWTRDY